VWTGGEVVPALAAATVLSHCPGTAVFNVYGPTEVTAFALANRADADSPPVEPFPIGLPLDRTTAHVLDARLAPVAPGEVGELYLTGAGLARGYLGMPTPTAERFVACPFGSPGRRMYRTGDMVRRGRGDVLEYIGRADNQVKIRGFRIEPDEVAIAASRLPGVRRAVVVVRGERNEQQLVLYVVGEPENDPRLELARVLPSYLVPAAVVVVDDFPVTSNGKLDRAALPAPGPDHVATPEHAGTATEKALAAFMADLLGVASVGPRDSFFALGGHSLLAMRLVGQVRAELGAHLRLQDVFDHPVVAELALAVYRATPARPALKPRQRPARVPLSPAQRRLWFLHHVQAAGTAYSVPMALRLHGDLDVDALRAALGDVTARHESLRTVFPVHDGMPHQRVLASVPAELPVLRARSEDLADLLAEAGSEPFDLATSPPLRAKLFAVGPRDHVLSVVAHHIAIDGWAVPVFWRDLDHAYRARAAGTMPDVPALPVQYADYALWQEELRHSEHIGPQLAYWEQTLADLPHRTQLPVDHPTGVAPGSAGETVACWDDADHARLEDLAAARGATLFSVVVAATAALLHRLGAGDDLPLGTVAAGRTDPALEDMVGFFVNTVVIRVDAHGDPAFGALLDRARTAVTGALEHQDVPFEDVVARLGTHRVEGENPLFRVMVTMERSDSAPVVLGDLHVKREWGTIGETKFDLAFEFVERRGTEGRPAGLECRIGYRQDLFTDRTADQFSRMLTRLVAHVAQHPDTRLGALPLLTTQDQQELLELGRGTALPLPETTPADLVAERALLSPDAVAVRAADAVLTYDQLNRQANRLAHHLIARGAGPEQLVVVLLPRTTDFVVAVLAVAKTGAAYVPLDPRHPAERIAGLTAAVKPLLVIDGPVDTTAWPDTDPPLKAPMDSAAYVIHTSGSTGTPKGVVVTRRGLLNLLLGFAEVEPVGPGDLLLACASSAFDVSVFEVWYPLVRGAAVCVAPESMTSDAAALARLGTEQGVTHVGLMPALLATAAEAFAAKRVITGAEPLPAALVERLGPVVNLYGPTEATVQVTAWSGNRADLRGEHAPIGWPLPGNGVHLLDRSLNPVPPGVIGELYLTGPQVARCYLGRPALTAERFVAWPYGAPGERMYRTGDSAWLRPDGSLEYVGRVDDQVKIRGVRVEPDEVAAHLLRDPEITAAAVIARDDLPGGRCLVAYVVPSAAELDATAVRARLAARLPSYLVPAHIVAVGRLPLTHSGKVDRRALPAPVASTGILVPRTPTEEVLCVEFADVLGLDAVSADDDFFTLGGHSLLAVRLLSRLHDALGVGLDVGALFRAPTPTALAAVLDDAAGIDGYAPLLPLRAGNGTPLFCIAPVTGLAWCYAHLARFLPSGVPVLGLQARGLSADGSLPASVAEAADDCTRLIRQAQPQGPYRLLGWSFGGVVAHAVAELLQAQGSEVTILALVDSYPRGGDMSGDIDWDVEVAVARHLAHGALATLGDAKRERVRSVAVHNVMIDSRHVPGHVRCPVLFVRAESTNANPDVWDRHLDGPRHTISLQDDHFGLMSPVPSARIAAAVTPLLDG
jgi:amino acid adenylation domain-containing protein